MKDSSHLVNLTPFAQHRTPLLILPIALLSLVKLNAEILTISGWEMRRIASLADPFAGVNFASSTTGNVNAGTVVSYVGDETNGDHTFTFDITADLDNDAIDDTFSFLLRVEAFTGSTFDEVTNEVTLGTEYDLFVDGAPTTANQHFGPGFDLDNGQSFRLSIESISYQRGGVDLDESFSFTGFTNVGRFGGAGGTAYYGLTDVESITHDVIGPANFSGPVTELVVTSNINNVRYRDLNFQFNIAGSEVLTGYDLWASINAPTGSPGDDFDNDGVSNGVEYVLGGSLNSNELSLVPCVTVIGDDMVVSFQRDQDSIDGTTILEFEVGTDLESFPTTFVIPDGATAASPGVTVVQDSPVAGTDTVTLTLPQAPDPLKFARLLVTP